MRGFVRSNTGVLTALLASASLALVFAAALRVEPARALPRAPGWLLAAIPHVNALVSLAAIGTILAGVRAIQRGNVDAHRRRMLATVVLFGTFLVLYLYRVALRGPTPFDGPPVLTTYVYYPLLGIHVSLAILTVPLVYYVLLLAYGHPIGNLPSTNHGRVGRIAAALWLVSFALGIVVYALLYWLF
jgi:putative membrane protein